MRGAQVVLGEWDGRAAAALRRDGQLDDLLIDGRDDAPGPGAVFRAVCDRPAKGQGGIFVRLPNGTGFLRGAKGRRPGEAVTVQVTGYAERGKAVPVTDRVLFKSRHVIVTPGAPGLNVARSIRDDGERDRLLEIAHDAVGGRAGAGVIVRSAAAGMDAGDVADDLAAVWDVAMQVAAEDGRAPEVLLDAPGPHETAWREWADVADVARGFDDHGIPDLVDALRSPEVRLGAASMVIEPTRAMVAVDVNTPEGGQGGGLRANLAAARALPRQLRLRGLAGQIVVDAAPIPKRDRRELEAAFKAAARADPIDTSFIGWTPLGHAELTRKRERRPLAELL